jgi:pyruvate/2-oxoglutarate dehydrogenase complex dihydrolipoamide dehydrogenase (E3) component
LDGTRVHVVLKKAEEVTELQVDTILVAEEQTDSANLMLDQAGIKLKPEDMTLRTSNPDVFAIG